MYTSWTKGLTEVQKRDLVANIIASKPLLKAITKRLKEELELSSKKQTENTYETSAWAYKQADFIGEQRASKKVLDLINNLYIED